MTTSELQVELAKRLGWTGLGCMVDSYHGDVWPMSGVPPEEKGKDDPQRATVPCLATLVRTAEQGLSDEQGNDYVANLWDELKLPRTSNFWTKENMRSLSKAIRASDEVRAAALIEVMK